MNEFGNVFYYALLNNNEKRVGLILGEKWFHWRTNSDIGLFILIQEVDEDKCDLIIISYAGSTGFLHISMGAHKKYIEKILEFLKKNGFEYMLNGEIKDIKTGLVTDDIRKKVKEILESKK